jgi:hypothetical protein
MSPNMPEFIQIVPELAQLVTVTDNGVLNFTEAISLSEQTDLAREVFEVFKPQVSVTYIVHRSSDEM